MALPNSKPPSQMSLGEAQVHVEAARQRQERHAQETLQSFDRKLNELRAYERWSSRWGHWVARVALLPLLVLLAGGCYVVIVALLEGRANSFSRYSAAVHVRAVEPFLYWFSVCGYAALTAFFGWLVVTAFRRARLRE